LEDALLNPGEIICDDRYQIVNRIGMGGMGVVYKARSLALKRDVALKMLTTSNEDLLRRFQREAHLLAQIDHPSVVQIHDIITSSPYGPILVMEYAEGRDLSDFATMDINEAVQVVLTICAGVNACHRYEIIHRDLKPGNIRYNKDGDYLHRVKILDFGLAIPFGSAIYRSLQTRITQVGTVVGTPGFIAPEILRGQVPDKSCDQYGIAMILYTLLTGRVPFANLQGDDLVHAILDGALVGPRLYRSDIPRQLDEVMTRAMDIDPQKRFPDVSAMAFQLVPFIDAAENFRWTRYFTHFSRPIPRRFLEPVSAANQREPEPLIRRLIVEPVRSESPRHEPLRPESPKQELPRPPIQESQPRPPTPVRIKPAEKNHLRRRATPIRHPKVRLDWSANKVFLAFAFGVFFGIAATVLGYYFGCRSSRRQ
jgi:serine/threonine protein kinase